MPIGMENYRTVIPFSKNRWKIHARARRRVTVSGISFLTTVIETASDDSQKMKKAFAFAFALYEVRSIKYQVSSIKYQVEIRLASRCCKQFYSSQTP